MIIPILDAALKVLDKVLPDPAAKAAAQLEVLKLHQAGDFKDIEADLQLAQMQADVNKAEASNPSLFVSGWRPAAGWSCVFGLAYAFIGQPLLAWASTAFHVPVPPPMDMMPLITMLGGMLGLGTIRMTEKIKGVAAK